MPASGGVALCVCLPVYVGVCTGSLAGAGVCPFVGLHPCVCPCLYVLAQVYLHVYPCTRVCQYTGVSMSPWVCMPTCGELCHARSLVPLCAQAPEVDVYVSMCADSALWVPQCPGVTVGTSQHYRGSLERFCCLHPSWRVSRPSHQQTGLSPQLSPPGGGGRSRDPLRSPPELMSLWSLCAARVFPSRAALQGTKRQ